MIGRLLSLLIAPAILWAAGAFISPELNPLDWAECGRFVITALIIIADGAVAMSWLPK